MAPWPIRDTIVYVRTVVRMEEVGAMISLSGGWVGPGESQVRRPKIACASSGKHVCLLSCLWLQWEAN